MQVSEIQEKFKTEAEGSSRLRKQISELTVAKTASEQLANEMQSLNTSLQNQREALQQEVASLQGQLSQEKSSRIQASDLHKELEGKSQFPLISFQLWLSVHESMSV